jgi:twinkle protein
MAGIPIDKLPHDCGTRQGLQVFANPETGAVDGFCFSCRKRVADPYGEKKTIDDIKMPAVKSQKEIDAELAEVDGYQTLDLPTRKLRAKHLEAFGIKVAVSEADGKTPAATYFPMQVKGKTTGYYIKTLDKDKITWSIGDVKGAEPFGWQRARESGAYKLIITEGKEDAVAVMAIFERHGDPKYTPAVIALPNGTNSVKSSLSQIVEEASRKFKEIIICFDDDKAGQSAVEDAMAFFPKALTVTLPYNDPNECIIKGATQAAFKALSFQAKPPKNTRIIIADDELHALAREPTPYGVLTWPYPSMNKYLRNMRLGETVYVGAGTKMGKSELLNDIAGHLIKEHDIKVFMAKPEEENKKTYKLMCNKMMGEVFHDPDVKFDYDSYDKAGKMLSGKLMMVDLYQHMGWESLKKDIVMASALGVQAVFIDPITNLTNGMNAADANTKLQEIAQELAAMALDLNIVIFIFVHLKAPEGNISKEQRQKKYEKGQYVRLGNCPHEFGGDIQSNQFAGSRAMMRSCNLMLALEGNKDPELEEDVRNMRWLTILEDREFGNAASVPLFWNRRTTFFKEV